MESWPFADPPNTASVTTRCIIEKVHPILRVTHDADDGIWQFLCGELHEIESSVVGLATILSLDETIGSIADLPLGWIGERPRVGGDWRRSKAPRLLTEAGFRATMPGKMLEITRREDDLYPRGVIDIVPYLEAIPEEDLQGMRLIPDTPPAHVYQSSDGRFAHVLYRLNRSNVYLVVVVKANPDDVAGHYVLSLGEQQNSRTSNS